MLFYQEGPKNARIAGYFSRPCRDGEIFRKVEFLSWLRRDGEMVDALDLGSSVRKDVEVQVLFPALSTPRLGSG